MTYTVAAIYQDGNKTVTEFGSRQDATNRYETYLYSVASTGFDGGLFMVTLAEGCQVVRGTMFSD